MYVFLSISLIALICFIFEHIQNKTKQTIQNAVKFCETKDSDFLLEMLCIFQESENMPSECIIGISEEWKIALEIIDDFKTKLAALFFCDKLPVVKIKKYNKVRNYFFVNYVLSDFDLFAYYLFCYLSNINNKNSASTIIIKDNDCKFCRDENTFDKKKFSIVLHKLLLITYIHSNKIKISGFTESEAEHIRLVIKSKRENYRKNDFHGPFVQYTGNDPDLMEITRKYIGEKAFELGLPIKEVIEMINQKRENAGIMPVYEDEII